MTSNGSIDKSAAGKLPAMSGTPEFLTQGQATSAANYLAANWAKAVGSLGRTVTVAATTSEAGARPVRAGRRLRAPAWLGTLPFLGYVAVFLLWPTGILIVNAFKNPSGAWNFGSVSTLFGPVVRGYFIGSFKLCLISAVAGAVFGALVAYAVASGKPDGAVRRFALGGLGGLAQFGGVTLAFAFQALIGPAGLLFHASWYYNFPWASA